MPTQLLEDPHHWIEELHVGLGQGEGRGAADPAAVGRLAAQVGDWLVTTLGREEVDRKRKGGSEGKEGEEGDPRES